MVERMKVYVPGAITGVERQSAAYSNIVYKVCTTGGDYIYKEFMDENEQEAKIAHHIAPQRIIASNSEFRIERYVESKEVSFDRDMMEIADALRRFHFMEIDGLSDFNALLDRQCVRACVSVWRGGDSTEPFSGREGMALSVIETIVLVHNRLGAVPQSAILGRSLCHNDLQPGNMLRTKDGVEIIDFDYTTVGNPCFDIANLFCEKMCDYNECVLKEELEWTREEKRIFVERYAGKDANVDGVLEEIEGLVAYSHWMWYLWSIEKMSKSSLKYFKYPVFGHSRLFFILRLGIVTEAEFEALNPFNILEIRNSSAG
jgi:choline/ethanolamine kinase